MHTHVHTHVVYVREHAPDKDVRMFQIMRLYIL